MIFVKSGVLMLLVSGLSASAAINLVAHKVSKELTGAEITALATAGYNSTAGNFIAVWAVSYSSAQPPGSVTDSAGDTFTPLTLNKGTYWGQWFYAKNVKGDPFNVITIHPALNGRATFIYVGMIVLEYSGVDPNSPIGLETSGTQGSLDGAWSSKPFDAASGDVVLLGIVTANGGAYTGGAGFKIEEAYLTPSSSKFSFAVLDQTVAAKQRGITAGVSWTGTLQVTGGVITLKGTRSARGQAGCLSCQEPLHEGDIPARLLDAQLGRFVRGFERQPAFIAAVLDSRESFGPIDESRFFHDRAAAVLQVLLTDQVT